MIVESLVLKNFRNYEKVGVKFAQGLNILVGKNGSGKTNVVEAIYYLSFARSFRTYSYQDLIKNQCEYGVIEAVAKNDKVQKKIRMVISKDGQKIMCNDVELTRLSDLATILNVLVFDPRDVLIFQSSPRIRRSFLNMQLSKLSPKYLEECSKCAKLTKERNAVLKSKNFNKTYLEVLDEQIITLSYEIVKARSAFIRKLEPIINKILRHIIDGERQVHLKYQSFVEECDSFEEFKVKAKDAFANALESDLKYKATTIGVHREDFSTTLNDTDLGQFGSQGEKRMVAISLKLAPYFLVEEKSEKPIVVLDDVLSELDPQHQDKLIDFVSKFNQVFITGTEISEKYKATVYEVANQNIMRRKTHGR